MQFEPEAAAQKIDPALMGIIIVVVLIGVVIGFAILAAICYMLQSCFARIPAQFRLMEPWQPWLLFIPCFGLIWNFFVYPKLAKSYQNYFRSMGRNDVGDCGEQLGLWYAITAVCSAIPFLNYIAGPAALILLIIFLVKAMSLKNQIGQAPVGYPPKFGP